MPFERLCGLLQCACSLKQSRACRWQVDVHWQQLIEQRVDNVYTVCCTKLVCGT